MSKPIDWAAYRKKRNVICRFCRHNSTKCVDKQSNQNHEIQWLRRELALIHKKIEQILSTKRGV